MATISLGDNPLQLDELQSLRLAGTQVALAADSIERVRHSRQSVETALASGKAIYGLNTGFGKLAGVQIPHDKCTRLQRNLLVSHACGVGDPLPVEQCRLALGLRIHALAWGYSGVRLELLEQAIALFNADMIPVIPSQGSVGASGDLAPLAHMALPLIGMGTVSCGGEVLDAADALARLGREPLELSEKEGLALINGTQIMTAIGLCALAQAQVAAKTADIACAMTVEALRGSDGPFEARIHELRTHRGQRDTAGNLRTLLKDSQVMQSHVDCGKVQDAYSLRCAPQVHGAAKDGLRHVAEVLETEANSVTDNPLVFAPDDILSGGNFHGQPVSQALDFLAIAVSTLANISERRIEQLVNPDISGLPAFLAGDPGLGSGFMIPHVVAAALASENKTLAHPASVDSIPTSASREDHVSMGVTAARHAEQVVGNTVRVLGIELLCAAQGFDLAAERDGTRHLSGAGVEAALAAVRKAVPVMGEDRFLAPDLAAAEQLVAEGAFVAAVEAVTGELALGR
ncbi:MAG: histidine ammonia-lyase [Planctomycetota bacterium]|nr:histidine ammonia-lyase [Planctomycetota bacterium]